MFAEAMAPSRILSTSTASASSELCPSEPLTPWRARSRARRTSELTPVSAVSVWPSQPRPSSALRAYCFWSEIDERIRIDDMVSLGESDGRFRTRPVETCSWIAASFAQARLERAQRVLAHHGLGHARDGHQRTSPVRLIRVSSTESMVRHDPGRSLVGVLRLQHRDHLLVEVDSGDLFAGGVDLAGQGVLVRRQAADGGDLGAEAVDEALVVVLDGDAARHGGRVLALDHAAADAGRGDIGRVGDRDGRASRRGPRGRR